MASTATSPPLVSVVIPMYNHAQYVTVCLESVRADDYRPVEIVIVDDGSPDNSYEVAEAWKKRYESDRLQVRLLRQANQGLTRTLNRLVQLASGDFVEVIASDDYLLPGGIRKRVEALQANPRWLAVFGDAWLVDERGTKTHDSALDGFVRAHKPALRNPRTLAMELILNWGTPGGAFLARREAYDTTWGIGLYDESLPFEDRDFFLRLIARDALGFVDAPVSAYRQHSENFFKQKTDAQLACLFHGRGRSEAQNLHRFHGAKWLALYAMFRLSHYRAKTHEQPSLWHTAMHEFYWKATRALYRLHLLRV